jgi:CheY-like chemotaxis protein
MGRILIVDDEEATRIALEEYFTGLGYTVDCAREAEEAEALVGHVRYDAIVADLRLTTSHGAEGLEIIGCVRERSPWTRIILLTAHASAEVEAEAHRRGVDRVLHKPQPLAAVAEIINALVGGH